MTYCSRCFQMYFDSYFYLKFVPRGPVNNKSITPQGINSLWPNDTIWRHKSRSTLAQVMA